MASLISGTPIAFNGKEAMAGIIEPAFYTPELTEFQMPVEPVAPEFKFVAKPEDCIVAWSLALQFVPSPPATLVT